jgi:hypothetical protein
MPGTPSQIELALGAYAVWSFLSQVAFGPSPNRSKANFATRQGWLNGLSGRLHLSRSGNWIGIAARLT